MDEWRWKDVVGLSGPVLLLLRRHILTVCIFLQENPDVPLKGKRSAEAAVSIYSS